MTSDFHCYQCGDPITGGVSQSKCLSCLMDIEDETYCQLCGEPCDPEDEHCDSCQEELDAYDESWLTGGEEAGLFGAESDA